MPRIPFNQGAFTSVDIEELSSPDSAAESRNVLHTDSGSIRGRACLREFASVGGFPIQGLSFFNDKIVAVSQNRRTFSIDSDGVSTEITGASPLEGAERPIFADDGTYLAIAGGGAPQRWNGTTTLSDMPGSPQDCTHIKYLDGYWVNFLLDDQELRIAGPTSVSRETWNSSDFFQAEGLPDSIRSIEVLLRELYVFGGSSTEIFQNFGDATAPFQRTFFIDQGIGAPYSILKADNTLAYLNDQRQIVQLQGRTPVLISGPYDRAIRTMGTVEDCFGARIDIGSHYLLAWTFPTEERTFVYDYKAKLWSEWDSYTGSEAVRFALNAHVFVKGWNRHFVGDPDTGRVWELTFDSQMDGDYCRPIVRRSGYYDHGTSKRKRTQKYTLNVKRGVGTPGGVEPKLLVRVRDDGKAWTPYKEIGLGFTGDARSTVDFRIGGIYQKRQIEFRMTDAAECLVTSLDEEVEVMTN
jgi:hypothetical protein